MAQCRYCFHADRDQIDALYVGGTPLRTIIVRFGGSLGAASRHRQHVIDLMKERTPGERTEHAGELLGRVEGLLEKTERILATCTAEKNFKSATAAIAAATRLLELLARLRGDLAPNAGGIHFHATKNVTNISVRDGDDLELALLVKEATADFSTDEINRLKTLADSATVCATSVTHAL